MDKIYLGKFKYANGGLVKLDEGGEGDPPAKINAELAKFMRQKPQDDLRAVNVNAAPAVSTSVTTRKPKGNPLDENQAVANIAAAKFDLRGKAPEGYVAKQVPGAMGSMQTVYENPQTGETMVPDVEQEAQQAIMDRRGEADQAFNNYIFPTGAGVFYGASNIAQGNYGQGALEVASTLPIPFLNWLKGVKPKQLPGSGNALNLEELRRVYHNSERFLQPEEARYLHKHGSGSAENYRIPDKPDITKAVEPDPTYSLMRDAINSGDSEVMDALDNLVRVDTGVEAETILNSISDLTWRNRLRQHYATYYPEIAQVDQLAQTANQMSSPPLNNPNWQQTWGTDNWNPNTSTSFKPKPVNKSGLTKEEVLQKASGKDKDVVSKMSENEFENTVLKPNGEIITYKPATEIEQMTYDSGTRNLILKDATQMSNKEYADAFNERLDLLNDIIAQRNKSGVEYRVKGLDENGRLVFETPSMPGAERSWNVKINPGQWRGDVEDIANTEYFRSIPGLEMSNTTAGVFGDMRPRKGSGAYESINEYLKKLDLGRVKPGFNSQTEFSKGAWENFIKSGRGVGFYANPSTVYGTMKTIIPPAAIGTGTAAVIAGQDTPQQKYGGWLNKYQDGGTSKNRLKKRLLNKYPAMQSVYGTEGENLNIIKDRGFIPAEYGYGNIEFINPGIGLVHYTDDYQYQSPTPDKYTIVYNPRGANRKDIALDMLHGMRDDQNYMNLLASFEKAVRNSRGNDMEYFYNEDVKTGFAEDGQEKWDKNYIDGLLRAEFARYMAKGKKDYKTERQAASPEMIARAKDIYNYVRGDYQKGGDISVPDLRRVVIKKAPSWKKS